jgi:hypothetical protein
MTRLTRSARGLLVAIAALALTGGAVFAARSLPSAATSGTQHAGTVSGKTIPATGAAPDAQNRTPDADEQAETPDAEDQDGAANAETPAGFDNHGAYVSSIAKGDAGKTDVAATGAAKSAEGKAKAAAAKAAHQH